MMININIDGTLSWPHSNIENMFSAAIAGVAAYNSHKLKKEATRVSSDESQATSSIPLVSSSTSNA